MTADDVGICALEYKVCITAILLPPGPQSWSLLENGVKGYTVSSPTVCGVQELAKAWTKQSDSVSMYSDVKPA